MKFYRARQHAKLTVGQSVRIAREFQEMTQAQLAKATGLTQATVSGIENDRVTLGAERARKLARALKVHPGVLLFPGWDVLEESRPRRKAA